ncbi:hypothetical protein B9Q11_04120 [Candidatus Marsarchaeota G2 archaeon ECH_B_SAG-F08]|uniref:Uncharacterized protein n=1 Tax=Candidatus Marsarchaeota G2 archaeon ECH_B_SAG-F08 TaxID=1978165 RepID=A0A2R6BFT8_9ARCH|nr:MAG: hypothetical protein B9Q11_04120 [Candidatus Marsarchaeota G2 archaeon ECH_B_SAG-F08]
MSLKMSSSIGLLGIDCELKAYNKTYKAIVIDETQKTWHFCLNGKTKRFPKEVITLHLNQRTIKGKELIGRPWERLCKR